MSPRRRLPRTFAEFVEYACELGYTVETYGRGGHPKVLRANGSVAMSVSGTAGDQRTYLNCAADLRRVNRADRERNARVRQASPRPAPGN